MSTARSAILARIRAAQSAEIARGTPPSAVADDLDRSRDELAAQFSARARAASATVVQVPDRAAVPAAIADYLAEHHITPRVHLANLAEWPAALVSQRLQLASLPMADDGDTLVSGCFAAVAEAGVVVLATGPEHAAEHAFLAQNLIVIVQPGQLVPSLETLWTRCRERSTPARMLNLVLGPSRTADLGVPSRLGAHGPLRVHVMLVGSS